MNKTTEEIAITMALEYILVHLRTEYHISRDEFLNYLARFRETPSVNQADAIRLLVNEAELITRDYAHANDIHANENEIEEEIQLENLTISTNRRESIERAKNRLTAFKEIKQILEPNLFGIGGPDVLAKFSSNDLVFALRQLEQGLAEEYYDGIDLDWWCEYVQEHPANIKCNIICEHLHKRLNGGPLPKIY